MKERLPNARADPTVREIAVVIGWCIDAKHRIASETTAVSDLRGGQGT